MRRHTLLVRNCKFCGIRRSMISINLVILIIIMICIIVGLGSRFGVLTGSTRESQNLSPVPNSSFAEVSFSSTLL